MIGFAIVSVQRCGDRTEGRRVDSVARPLELNAFETVRRLVHLEEDHHRHPAKSLPSQNGVSIAVAKVEGATQPPCFVAELTDQLT